LESLLILPAVAILFNAFTTAALLPSSMSKLLLVKM